MFGYMSALVKPWHKVMNLFIAPRSFLMPLCTPLPSVLKLPLFLALLLSLSITILRFIHPVSCMNCWFYFIAKEYSVVWVCHHLFILSPFGRYLRCFYFWDYIWNCHEHLCISLIRICFYFSWVNAKEWNGLVSEWVYIGHFKKLPVVFQSDYTIFSLAMCENSSCCTF